MSHIGAVCCFCMPKLVDFSDNEYCFYQVYFCNEKRHPGKKNDLKHRYLIKR